MKNPTLIDELRHHPFRFDFFQAVRVLERIAREQAEVEGLAARHPVGRDHAPKQEAVRFRAIPSHSFPAGSVSEVRLPAKQLDDDEAPPPEMIATFMGTIGPGGVLPRHYTSLVIERIRDKDYSLRDFLDLFHHRVISLFYRAWEKYRFPFGYERSELASVGDKEDWFTQCLYSLLGLGTGALRGRVEFDDEAFLYYAGHFAHRPRSAVSLELILADYFELPARVVQFQGQWLRISPEDQSSLPCPRWPRGLNTRLGVETIVGERVWDVTGKFRVRLGPLVYSQFCRFVPSGDALRPLGQMVRSYAGPQFDFDVQPVLQAAEVPWCRLGGGGTGVTPVAHAARLGWNTWIRSGRFQHDVSDAVFSLEG